MSTHSFLSRLPLRAARWSATHPWRAIGAWFAFVVIAVGLAFMIPTQQTKDADYRIGDSGRADAMVAHAHLAGGQVESVLVTAQGGGTLDRQETGPVVDELTSRASKVAGVVRVAAPQLNRDGTALLVDVHLRSSVDDVSALQQVTSQVAAAHPDLSVREAGDVSVNDGDQRPGGRGPALRGGHQPADHPPADAAGLRRPDRGRCARAARAHLGRGHDGHRRPAVAPDPRRADGDQHDRADRHGGRASTTRCSTSSASGRSVPRAARPSMPSRSPRRRPATRSWSPAGRDRLDGGAVHRRRARRSTRSPRARSSWSRSR